MYNGVIAVCFTCRGGLKNPIPGWKNRARTQPHYSVSNDRQGLRMPDATVWLQRFIHLLVTAKPFKFNMLPGPA